MGPDRWERIPSNVPSAPTSAEQPDDQGDDDDDDQDPRPHAGLEDAGHRRARAERQNNRGEEQQADQAAQATGHGGFGIGWGPAHRAVRDVIGMSPFRKDRVTAAGEAVARSPRSGA